MGSNNVKTYVYYCADKFISIGLIRQMVFTYVFMSLIGLGYGVIGKGPLIVVAIILIALTLLYTIFVIVLPKLWNPSEFSHRFMVNGCFATFMAIYFECWSFLFVFLEEDSRVVNIYICVIIMGLFVSLLLSFTIVVEKVKKDGFRKKKRSKKRHKNIVVFASVGAILGILSGKLFLSELDQRMAIKVVICLCLIIVSMCAYGTTNFLKYYYVKKYSFQSDGLEDVIAMQLHPPKKKKKGKKAS